MGFEEAPADGVGDFVAIVLMGLVFAAIGFAAATDYRKYFTRHLVNNLRASASLLRTLDRIPPWRWTPPIDPDNLPKWVRYQQIAIGTVFAGLGTVMIVYGLVGLVDVVLL